MKGRPGASRDQISEQALASSRLGHQASRRPRTPTPEVPQQGIDRQRGRALEHPGAERLQGWLAEPALQVRPDCGHGFRKVVAAQVAPDNASILRGIHQATGSTLHDHDAPEAWLTGIAVGANGEERSARRDLDPERERTRQMLIDGRNWRLTLCRDIQP